MEEKQEKQIQHKIIYDFNQLVEEVKENKNKFLDLLSFVEKIELPSIRKVCTMQTIHLKRQLNIKGDYEFLIIIWKNIWLLTRFELYLQMKRKQRCMRANGNPSSENLMEKLEILFENNNLKLKLPKGQNNRIKTY